MTTPAVCPVCGGNDAIQKVTSIVLSGISTGTLAGPTGGLTYSRGGGIGSVAGYSQLRGSQVSGLASKFVAPAKPEVHADRGLVAIAWCLWGFFILYALGFSCASSGYMSEHETNSGLAVLGVVLVVALLASWGIHSQLDAAEKELPKRMEKWTAQMAIYERLYYCHRDDVVFDPETDKKESSQNFQKLLEIS